MHDGKANPYSLRCPSRHFIELVGDKWVLLVLQALAQGISRNGQLLRTIEGISQKMLTLTIRRLESRGLVARHDYRTIPPRVDYTMTELGNSFRVVLVSLGDWMDAHLSDLGEKF